MRDRLEGSLTVPHRSDRRTQRKGGSLEVLAEKFETFREI